LVRLPDGAERERVELVVERRREAGVLDAHVAQLARVVVVGRAAAVEHAVVLPRRRAAGDGSRALDLDVAGAVDQAVADDDQPAPVARLPLSCRTRRREHDRRLGRAGGLDLRAAHDEQRRSERAKSPWTVVPGWMVRVAPLATWM
jgi:hypothetical protein